MKDSTISPLKTIATALCLFFFLYFLLKLFVVDIMLVEGRSMEPTFSSGEIIFINKLAYGLLMPFKNEYITYWAYPERDDIIVSKEPEEGKLIVKRCIGIAGDPVSFKEGRLIIAQREIPYNPALHFSLDVHTGTVPPDTIFVMGDNPCQSVDSRHFGYIPVASVYAKVIKAGKKQKRTGE
ncbi:MAG: signal peptidase I [Spirochaetales bacterium]|nr:signal peptidase I [Spirochaetales bacterium]